MSGSRHECLLAITAVAALVVGCAGAAVSPGVAGNSPGVAGNKEGGAGQNRLSLTIVTGEGAAEEADAFARAVGAVANGTIEVKVDNQSIAVVDSAYEASVIKYVAAGKAQLGFSASRAFDTVGVKSFVGLQAPFLIDSQGLEDRVLSSDAAKRLLEGTRSAGIVGISYLQGGIRRPLGLTRDLLEPSDFVGARIGFAGSALTETTLKALGASPVLFMPGDSTGLDGMEAHLGTIDNNKYDKGAKSLTSNVMFWPRPGVIFANAKVFDGLSAEQQQILRSAGEKAYQESVTTIAAHSVMSVDILCGRGLKFVAATQAAISDLRRAVQPVYDEIEKDPGTKATIEAIDALRASAGATPDVVKCSAASASHEPVTPPAIASPIDGTWAVCFNHDEFVAASPGVGEDRPENIGCFDTTLRKGQFWTTLPGAALDLQHPNGTFTADETTVTLISPESGPEIWQYKWSLFKDTMTWKKDCVACPTGLAVKPFHKVADAKP
jgi:TRAP-type C4-dicarboxylate transport system substrate-binding protein